MKIYIKIIRNNTSYAENDIQKFLAWIKRNTPLEPEVDFVDSNLPLKWKPFNINVGTKKLWGLDGIKEQLRQAGLVPQSRYHIVIFLYDCSAFGQITDERSLGHFTYPNDLNGAAFMEVAATTYWETLDDQYRVATHEFCHCGHRLAWWSGLNTPDSMDVYDKEFEPDAPDGNRARNLAILNALQWSFVKELEGRKITNIFALPTSAKKLDLLKPKVKELALRLQEECRKQGFEIVFLQTYRTIEEQERLYAQGRTTPGKIVTQVRRSYHNYGVSFDCSPFVNGKIDWNDLTYFKKMGEIGKTLGLEWGGDWQELKDYSHFQYPLGYSIKDFENGLANLSWFGVEDDEELKKKVGMLKQIVSLLQKLMKLTKGR